MTGIDFVDSLDSAGNLQNYRRIEGVDNSRNQGVDNVMNQGHPKNNYIFKFDSQRKEADDRRKNGPNISNLGTGPCIDVVNLSSTPLGQSTLDGPNISKLDAGPLSNKEGNELSKKARSGMEIKGDKLVVEAGGDIVSLNQPLVVTNPRPDVISDVVVDNDVSDMEMQGVLGVSEGSYGSP
ncbi:hypothetical protein QYF36_007883 [Acer negundo]|nr:hypothetical protein QYF36_007883 [Acer negundo]